MTKLIAALVLVSSAAFANDSTIDQAQTAYVDGHYQKSIDLARSVTATEGEKAWRLIAISACFLKDRPQVVEANGHLGDQGEKFVRFVCHRNGIEL